MPSSPQLCPECGRRPSERVGTRVLTRFGMECGLDVLECHDPIHDAADAAPEMLASLRELVEGTDDYWEEFEGAPVVANARALLARFPKEGE